MRPKHVEWTIARHRAGSGLRLGTGLGRGIAIACFLISLPALAQVPSLSPTGSPTPASPVAPGDLSRPAFDTQTPVYDPNLGAKPPNMMVAEVEGRPITLADVRDLIATLPPDVARQDFQALYPRAVEQLVYRTALAIRGRDAGLDNDPVLARRIQAGADHLLANAWLHKYLDGKLTEQMVRARYERDILSQPPPEEVHLRLIVAETQKQARETIAALAAGADFATLARRSSKDASASNGGDLGFLPWRAVIPELAGVAQGLAAGETAPIPVRAGFGWMVVRLEERRPGTRPSFAEMREELLATMEQEQASVVAEDTMKTMIVRTFAFSGAAQSDPNAPDVISVKGDKH